MGSLSNRYVNTVLQLANILRSRTFCTADNIKADPITLGQRFETLSLDRGMMDENVLTSILLNKTKTF